MNTLRICEDRVPTEKERSAVRARMVEAYVADSSRGVIKTRRRSFKAAWQAYMRDEQAALNELLNREVGDKSTIEDVLSTVSVLMNTFGYTALKAIRMFNFEPGMKYHMDLKEEKVTEIFEEDEEMQEAA